MHIDIDTKSGFCFGVVNAINRAEEALKEKGKVNCLGDIVHNGAEVDRLEAAGMRTINKDDLKTLKNETVLLRAHGEPPSTYQLAKENNIKIIDATCPVVLNLQSRVRRGYQRMKKNDGQVVIYGKFGHAEVIGLMGQTEDNAILITTEEDLNKIDYTRPIHLFSQTTKSIKSYEYMRKLIEQKIADAGNLHELKWTDSICRQVSNKEEDMRAFSRKYEIIIFVGGKKSSNAKQLFEMCIDENPNTYFVSNESELQKEWFNKDSKVGICGATSTPVWLMEKVKGKIFDMFK